MSANYRTELHIPAPNTTRSAVYLAAVIQKKYGGRIPSPQQLRDQFGMSRATAYRWVSALQWAKGESA